MTSRNEIGEAVHRAIEEANRQNSAISPNQERNATLAYLSLVIDTVRPFATRLTGSIHVSVDRIGLSLYVTLIQLAESVLIVARNGPNIAVPTLVRQALDAFVDLCNILQHENYWKRLECADDQSWTKELEHASAAKNPFLRAISDSGETLIESRRLHAKRIAEWKRQGITKAEAEERFELAGMTHEYDALWLMLSAYMHNNVSLLMSRHFSSDDEGRPLQLDLHPTTIPYELAYMSHVGELLTLATEKVHERFGSGPIDLSNARRAAEALAKSAAEAENSNRRSDKR